MMFIILVVAGVVLVVGLGLLVFTVIRRSPRVVPDVVDRQRAPGDRIVAVDDEGQPVTEAQAGEEGAEPRDTAAFEDVLKDQLEDQRR